MERYERRPNKDIIKPHLSDYKVLAYSAQNQVEIFDLPSNPRSLEDIIDVVNLCLGNVIYSNRSIENETDEARIGALIVFTGAPGRGKNVLELLLNDAISDFINRQTGNSEMWNIWEELRNTLYYAKAFPDLPSIYTPFETKHNLLIKKKFEQDLAEYLEERRIVFATKSAGTYIALDDEFIVEREFGSDTIRKISWLKEPFDKFDPSMIEYVSLIAIVASPFVTQVLKRYRAALQLAGNDLHAINVIQDVFKMPHVDDVIKREEVQEGGNMRQVARTDEAIDKLAIECWKEGYYTKLPLFTRELFKQIYVDKSGNKEIVEDAPGWMQEEADIITRFISKDPTYSLIAEVIKSRIREQVEFLIHKITDLQIGDFYQPKPFEPLMSMVVENSPDVSKYMSNVLEIREIFEKYGLS